MEPDRAGAPEGEFPDEIVRLGRLLYEEMENLDPGMGPLIEFDSLTDRQRAFYSLLVKRLLDRDDWILDAIKRISNNSLIDR